ncbi:hypothetical protein PVT67_17900 [Gallaecimonas kandeliae]|uniref:hypothetical protein n=1 Tax=Gallaecimonas kandeliae TaxID=3029055 RepID=UPI0026482884|nr:hypothetical protein [Gallaecimonas kandeliae]WKE65516.1 hypothetical protein PVT67_17900 [Gallaecimonas kandeliae]
MPQKQHTVPVIYKDGQSTKAIAKGNNVAWICKCDGLTLLLGQAGSDAQVTCDACNSTFLVQSQEDGEQVLKVVEL